MNTLESIAASIGGALEPLTVAFSSPRGAEQLINALGWQLPPGVTDIGLSKIDVAGLVDKVTDLRAAGKFEGSDSGVSIGISADLLVTVQAFLRDLNNFANGLNAALSGDYLNRTRIREEFPRRLLDYLFIQELRLAAGPVLTVFSLTGIVRFEPHTEDPLNFGSAHVRHIVAYERIGSLLTDAGGQLRQFFDWGTPQFDSGKLLLFFGFFLQAIGGRVKLRPLAREVEERLSGHSVPEADTAPLSHLVASFKARSILDDSDIGLIVLGLRPSAPGGSDGGFAFSAFVRGTADRSINLRENLKLELDTNLDLAEGTVASFRPGHPLLLQTGVSGKNAISTATQGRMAFRTTYPGPAANPIPLFAIPSGTSLTAKEITFAFGVDTKGAGPIPFVEIGLNQLHLHLSGVGSDGFLVSVLPLSLDADFDLLADWDGGGIYLQGSSALQVQLASHISIGLIEIVALTLGVGFDGGQIATKIASSIKGSLGPLTVLVEGIGVEAKIRLLGDNSGNLGPIDLVTGLTLPDGVGLSLNAGIVTGGGFLYFDPDKGEYAGALQLSILDVISVSAVGLITTHMPDGASGFSLLIIITADFGPGIQLGFGFTLLAVGGLLGLNRGVRMQPLLEGVKSNAIASVMFPRDIIANAPRIISDLKAFFPPQANTFLIGPMAKLGWGEPTLVSLSLGVIVEIPPGNVAILGVLRAALPAEDAPILVLQVNFIGVFEPNKQRFYFFAALFDSHLLFITIDGQMGVLFAYGADANFVMLIGGFHPQFKPPPLPFPTPARIQIDIINESYARIHCDGYFAVTTNTVQFGTHSSYYFGFSALSVEGHSGFDALIQYSPFHFIAEISTAFSVKVFGLGVYGIDIDLSLEGPSPWHAHGTASISFLFFSIGIGIDFTWGDSRDTLLPPVAVMPILGSEFGKRSNWRALPPTQANLLVSLRKFNAGNISDTDLVLHPVGTLQISQRAVPLDLTLDKIGSQKPSDANRFSLSAGVGPLRKTRDLQEQFAPGQFKDYADADRLSAAAYSPSDSGIELSAPGTVYASGTVITRIVRYDVTIIDKKLLRQARRFVLFAHGLFQHLLLGSSVARSPLSAYQKSLSQPDLGKVILSNETFAVAFAANNQAYHADAVRFTSIAAANDFVARTVTANPSLSGTLHVLPSFECAA